ncbi:MAG: hypothetical protein ACRDD1_21860, partial [Planctomycetia bacterium]
MKQKSFPLGVLALLVGWLAAAPPHADEPQPPAATPPATKTQGAARRIAPEALVPSRATEA